MSHTELPWFDSSSPFRIIRNGETVATFTKVEDRDFVLRLTKAHEGLLVWLGQQIDVLDPDADEKYWERSQAHNDAIEMVIAHIKEQK